MGSEINKINLSVAVLICAFWAFFSWFVLHKFQQGIWCGYDHGVYHQVLWNTAHGNFFWCSFSGDSGLCDLGSHVQLIMLLLVPFYLLLPLPCTLPILQVFSLGLGGLAVYLIAKEKINARVGLLFAVLYCANNFVVQAIIEGFQVRTFTMPLFLFAFYFLIKKRYVLFSCILLVASLAHETNSLVVFMLGLYTAIVCHKRVLGFVITVLSLIWFILCVKIIQPYFGSSEPLVMLNFLVNGTPVSDPAKIMQFCLAHPVVMLQRVFSYPKLDYLIRLFLPLGFMSLFSPAELLIGLPVFLQNLVLSDSHIGVEIPRYTMALLPFIFISAIYSTAYFYQKIKARRVYFIAIVVVCWAISVYKFVWDPGYNRRFTQIAAPVSDQTRRHRNALKDLSKRIPATASVCADVKAFPYLCNRVSLYDFPNHFEKCEYVLIDTKEPHFPPKPERSEEEYLKTVAIIQHSKDYRVIKRDDGLVLLEKTK